MHQGVRQALAHRHRLLGRAAPGQVLFLLRAAALEAVRNFQQAVGGIFAAVQDHVFHALAQLGIELVIHAELAGVDDAHVHARADGVVQEHGVDRLAHRVVAAERERDVGHAAADLGIRQVLLDPARGLDEVHRVVVVLLDAGRDREDIRVEDDVFRRKADFIDQDVVAALADLGLALEGVGLALLIEGHHHRGGAIAADQRGVVAELFLALLERDRVDHWLALHALQAGLDHFPLRRVDHDRHARNVRLGGDQVQEANHGGLRVQHGLVHVDVDDLRAILDLLAGHRQRLVELAVQDHAREGLGAGHVGALADVDEQRVVVNGERLEAGQAHRARGQLLVGHVVGLRAQAASRYWPGQVRGVLLATRWAIAAICSGVVPQQPPTRFTSPEVANSSTSDEVTSGVSSKPVSLIGFGKPAFG